MSRRCAVLVTAVMACHTRARDSDISASELSADIRTLAADQFEGRGTASRSERLAQHYVANRFTSDVPAVFVGYAITAPELRMAGLRELDVPLDGARLRYVSTRGALDWKAR